MKPIDFGKIVDPIIAGVARLTKTHKIMICAGLVIVLGGGFSYFSYYPKFQEIGKLTKEQIKLDKELAQSKEKASQISVFREKMRVAEAQFLSALQVLPEKKEIPSLLTNISRSGQNSGLDFLLFQPQPEVAKEFYEEIPVSIEVDGGYHNVAMFFDKVSRLSRMVNIENIKMVNQKDSLKLRTSCTAVTYRFVDKPTEATGSKKPGEKKG
jgi:type IV pilus assembly protein PilO